MNSGCPEEHYDMHGLFPQVMPSGFRQFVQRLSVAGKRSGYGLRGHSIISLAEAREAAWENRRVTRRGEVLEVEARCRVTVARRRGAAGVDLRHRLRAGARDACTEPEGERVGKFRMNSKEFRSYNHGEFDNFQAISKRRT